MRSMQDGLLPCQVHRVSRVGQQTAFKLIAMADRETPAYPPRVDKEMVKEALHEILNKLPAFLVAERRREKERRVKSGGTWIFVLDW